MTFTAKMTLLLSFIIFLTGCKKTYVLSDNQSILFQYEYINYSWGFQHNGFIIDSEGNVITYNNPEEWNFHDKDYNYTESQIAENLDKCTRSEIKVPLEELRKYSSYIDNMASTKVTAMKNVAADAGTREFICYQFSETGGMYKGYLIKMEGDFTCENLNFYSKKVSLWLRDISNEVLKK